MSVFEVAGVTPSIQHPNLLNWQAEYSESFKIYSTPYNDAVAINAPRTKKALLI